MSEFFSARYAGLIPYTPGEQPKDMKYIKLNTNESPFPPSPAVERAVAAESGRLQLYSDPENRTLRERLARRFSVSPEEVVVTNGSDEVLNFAFMAFADESRPLRFPDITYGFYPVFANLHGIPYTEVPLREDFSIAPEDYTGVRETVVIANPNAPTGLSLSLVEIERIVASNPENVVIVDEAYVDFGAESAIPLTKKYKNLLVTGTFSKSRSMAGARLGFGIGNKALIADLNTLRYSTNPYNVNRMTEMAGVAALEEDEYYMSNCRTIVENREWTTKRLQELGFSVLSSRANFVFAACPRIGGKELYLSLKERGVLVRHFDKDRIREYNRITVGTREQMEVLIRNIEEILKERSL
ncbi:MAG: histidinol-phosphate transaminase [Clostridia bacterium]|nr:histidinol-phosphate transaminase [Clostridia bacterium]